MPDDERETPSIAPPSLRFGRRKRATDPAPEPVQPQPVAEPAPVPVDEAPTQAAVVPPVPAEPVEPATDEDETLVGPAPSAATVTDEPGHPVPARRPRRERAARTPREKPARVRRPRASEPVLTPRVGVAVTGAVVGLLMVLATFGVLRGCEAVRGTATCGGGPGTLLLLAIVVLAIWAGGLVLRLLRLPESGGTSFLGVGLLCVIALLFFLGQLEDWWMVIVLPLIAAATFTGAFAINTAVLEED